MLSHRTSSLWLLAIAGLNLGPVFAAAVPIEDREVEARQVGSTPGTCIYYSNQCVTQFGVYICDSGNCSKDDNACSVVSGVSHSQSSLQLLFFELDTGG
jgi:hypothetical protein